MAKTISVRVTRLEKHRYYHKYVRRHTTYKAHDEKADAKEGDVVRIEATRPLSKTKRWRLIDVVRRAPVLSTEGVVGSAGDSSASVSGTGGAS